MASALLQLQNMLPDLHLLVNTAKCELYAQAGTVLPDSLICCPLISDEVNWSFLGAPLTEKSTACLDIALERFRSVTARIGLFASGHPMEALALIRSCTGACRVQHLLQAGLPPSHQLSFVTQCSNSLLNAVNAVVGATLNPHQWDIARTPIKLGGLGVHDPYHCV